MSEFLIRPYVEEDKPRIQALHQAQGLDYAEPDWEKMLISAVVEADGQIEIAAFLRKTAETYLLLDPKADTTKRVRIGELLMLHRELLMPAQRVGFTDVHCWLPPEMEEKFGKLLLHLGWKKALWPCYSREVK